METKPRVFALDAGYADNKSISPEGKIHTFPSAVATPQQSMAAFGGGQKIFVMDHGTYVFGNDALVAGSRQIQSLDDEWLLNFLPGFVVAAATFAGVDLHNVDVLSTGLPVEAWRKYKVKLSESLKTIHCNGETYKFARVDVRPQSVGVLGLHTMNGAPAKEKGIVLDIGSNTLHVLCYEDLRPISTNSHQYNRLGVYTAAHTLVPFLQERAGGIKISDIRAMQALRERSFRGEDISTQVDSVISNYILCLLNDIRSDYRDIIPELHRLVVAGGGAYLVGEDLKKEYPRVTVLDQPEYANVRGYAYLSSLQV